MGCGSSYTAPGLETSTTPQDNMLCDLCQARLNFINRKKVCTECGNCFCGSCLPRENGKTRTCSRCKVLVRRPGERTELMKLRVKDLQNYLGRRQINIKSCVEKKDLVELVLQSNGDENEFPRPSGRVPPSRSWEDTTIRVSDQVPLERPSNFPKSYVESSHRREWFEKFGAGESSEPGGDETEPTGAGSELSDPPSRRDADPSGVDDNADMISVDETPVIRLEDEEGEEEITLVQRMVAEEEEELIEVTEIPVSTSTEPNTQADTHSSEGAVGGVAESRPPATDSAADKGEEDTNKVIQDVQGSMDSIPVKNIPASRLYPDLIQDQISKSAPSSPRRFANQGVVYLSEIQSVEELADLSARQAKEILAMNRVNFKGCVEKEELLKIIERLWKQEMRNRSEAETMEDDSLCKICMDAPIDCVMLECGHMCTCTNCGKQMAECPICRQYVIRVVRTFKA